MGSSSEISMYEGPGKRIDGVPGGSGATVGEIRGRNSGFLPKYYFLGKQPRGVAHATAHARHRPLGGSKGPLAPLGPVGPKLDLLLQGWGG